MLQLPPRRTTSKAIALAREYRLGVAETEFWTVHADVEQDHAEWTTQALEVLEASPESTEYWASHSARHWWAFLDERNSQPAA